MQITKLQIELRFIEPTLATSPGNRNLAEQFIVSRTPDAAKREEELAALPADEQLVMGTTVFPRDAKGDLFCWDYQLRGYFKESIYTLIELGDCPISKWAYKKAVDNFLFVKPRHVYWKRGDGALISEPDGFCERSLRASTLQGDRIALARSEQLHPPVTLEFTVELLRPDAGHRSKVACITPQTVECCLALGERKGFSQWRGGGYGRFEYTMIHES